ncbi:MAG: EamA family transporter [Tepidisphaera sp.]|nr:EamA family transporter [Tepidisphaera sp.]
MSRAILFACLAGLCWGVGEIGTKFALNTRQVGPLTASFIRAAVTLLPALIACLLATRVWKTEPPQWWTMSPRTWLNLVIGSGLLAGFAGVFFFYLGLGSPGGDISRLRPIAFALAPATAVLLGWLVLGEPMTLRKALACTLIVIGIVLLAGEGHGAAAAKAS